jgi:acyl carrier protein
VRPWTSYANQPQRGASGTDLASALRDHLRERLPAFMLPQEVVLLDKLPRTPNGKIDRAALPRPERAAPRPIEGQRPRNELERTISSVFESLLGSSEMGVETNFFELGANSLLLVRASGQLEERLQRPVSLVDFFRFPSIRQLAQRLGDPAEPLRAGVSQGQDRAQARRDLIQRRAAERAKK